MAWTPMTTFSTGNVLTAAQWNAQVRDNIKHLAEDRPSCRVSKSSAQLITSATDTDVTWTTEDWDYQACHSTVTNTARFTAPQAGRYRLHGNITWDPGVGWQRTVLIVPSSSGTTILLRDATSMDGLIVGQAFSWTYFLAVGDYVRVRVNQTTTSSINVRAGSWAVFDWIGT